MSKTGAKLITLPDGRVFPSYEGEPLSWDIGLYNTWAEEEQDYPRARTVIAAMKEHRPEQLNKERREYLRASFDRMFGHNAKKMLNLIEEEVKESGYGRGRARPRVRRARVGWRGRAPKLSIRKREIKKRCGSKAFLDPQGLRYPVMGKRGCVYDCQGILAAYKRAGQYKDYKIQLKAVNLGKRLGCRWAKRAAERLPELRRKAK